MIASPHIKIGNFILTQRQVEALEPISSRVSELLLVGGARSGKTTLVLLILLLRCIKYPGARFFWARHQLKDVRIAVVKDTLPKVCRLLDPAFNPAASMNLEDMCLKFNNSSELWFIGLTNEKSAEKALGREYAGGMFNEISEIDGGTYNTMRTRLAQKVDGLPIQIFSDCNPPHMGHWSYKRFVKKVEADGVSPLPFPDSIQTFKMNPVDNAENLPEGYIERTLASLPWRKRERFLEGKWGNEVEGALWKISYIKRSKKPDSFDRVVVAIDPAITTKKESNETGIIVAGSVGDKAYILEDASGKWSPQSWAKKVVYLYEKHQCDKIIAESNQGGELVKQNLKVVSKILPIGMVRAKRGKVLRAEPIVSLYEEEKIFHVGQFPDLEDQMISWKPEDRDSPDRIDALVYAIFDLLMNKTRAFVYAV